MLADEPELLEFFSLFDRWREVASWRTSTTMKRVGRWKAPRTRKARVVTLSQLRIEEPPTAFGSDWFLMWNRVVRTAQRTVRDLHGLARARIQAKFAGYHT